jgi:hypothetical protein
MRVIIAVAVVAFFLPTSGCSYRHQVSYAEPVPPPVLPPTKRKSVKLAATMGGKFPEARPRSRGSDPSVPPAAVMHYLVLDTAGNCAVVDSKPSAGIIGDSGGYASLESAKSALKAECKEEVAKKEVAAETLPTTLEMVGEIADALNLSKIDQAIRVAKAYMDSLKVKVGTYYQGLAVDRPSSEEIEAALNLVPGTSLFDSPEQGITNLKLLRAEIQKEVVIDETDAKNNGFTEARHDVNERLLNARSLIRAIGTDDELANALAYLQTLRTEPKWQDFVKRLNSVVQDEAEVRLKAAEAKAKKLGGPHKLNQEDIEGLSFEQIKQLRGY